MGQTLTHGVYLPDEGERNCYNGLAGNWQLLDNSVGTIAEHTTQIAGKAPAVHTHTKSDVTDLLNSNFIPSANNSYDLGSSSYQWNNVYSKRVNTQTLNGINPGALSLPGSNSGINTDNWDKTGATVNSYTPAVDGWLVLRCKDVAGDYLFATWSGGAMRASVTGQGLITVPAAGLCVYIPVKAGTTVDCVVKATDKFGAYIYPCLGNV